MKGKTALYRHYDARGNLLYIGISLSAVQRLKQHMGKVWAADIAKVEIEHHPTRDEALSAEAAAIKDENPTWNVKHKGKLSVADSWHSAFAVAGFFDRPAMTCAVTGNQCFGICHERGSCHRMDD